MAATEKKIPYREESKVEGDSTSQALAQSTLRPSEFDTLISLLTSEQREEINKLSKKFSDPEHFIERVKDILPEAIARRGKQDKVLTQLLVPTVEEVLESSTKQDPDALAAKMLPTIRRSIRLIVRETFNDLIINLNRSLDHSLNLNWRLEAWRTGRPFSEVILSKTLVYRVEQVFLIHIETGILLKQVIIDSEQSRDGDLISGMLTAIQDFVRDSFKVDQSETLNNFRVGELSVLIEQDEAMLIAAVVRGLVPANLDDDLQRTVSLLHMRFRQELKHFTGDTTAFEDAEGPLKACLIANFAKSPSRPNFMLWIVLILVGVSLVTFGVSEVLRNRNWSQALKALESQGGVVITEAKRSWNNYQLKGLLDPLAEKPSNILASYGIASKKVSHLWEPYYALEETIVLKRVQEALMPPSSVSLSLQEGTLKLTGSASSTWQEFALLTARNIMGVERINTLELYSSDNLDFNSLIEGLEAKQLYFEENSEALLAGQESTLSLIKQSLIPLHNKSLSSGYEVEVLIISYSYDISCKYKAHKLAKARAQRTLESLTENSPARLKMTPLAFVQKSNPKELSETGKIKFKVVF